MGQFLHPLQEFRTRWPHMPTQGVPIQHMPMQVLILNLIHTPPPRPKKSAECWLLTTLETPSSKATGTDFAHTAH
jgi:hypothetical protein